MPKPRVFLDTSALFAAVMSATGGGRALLKLGETGVISLLVGPTVLAEADAVFRRKAADLLPLLATLLARANIETGNAAGESALARAGAVIDYEPDVRVVAEALTVGADYIVTHDRKHLLENPRISELPGHVGTPSDCLAWLRERLASGA